ncbi:ABC transporter ATP-binding protein/permease [Nitrospiraceae bacterium AH_259_D15_M11_P09]|nr:ABC transporter ATP-binding protein/permease [Nitrospiraceae bacterium AH_259_D15_M11_P09]
MKGSPLRQYFHQYFSILGDSKSKLPLLLGFFLFSSLLDVVGIGMVGSFGAMLNSAATDDVQLPWGQAVVLFRQSSGENAMVAIGVAIVLTFYIKGVSAYWVRKRIVRFSMLQLSQLRQRLMRAYQTMHYHFYLSRNTAELIQSINGHTTNFTSGTLMASLSLAAEAITVLFVVGLLLVVNAGAVAAVSLIIVFMLFIYYRIVRVRILAAGRACNLATREMIRGITEGMRGFKEIRVLGREIFFCEMVKHNAERFAKETGQYQGYQIIPRYLMESVLVTFIIGMCLAWEQDEVGAGQLMPMLGIFGVAALRLMPAANQMMMAVNQLRFSRHSMMRVYQDLREIEKIGGSWQADGREAEREFNAPFSRLVLENVWYTYAFAKSPSIRNLSLTVSRGETVGLIGKSGSGKTTLIDIILGFLVPQEGRVLVNGSELTEHPRGWLNRVAYIPQMIFLTDDTLRNNIALGFDEEEIGEKWLEQVIDLAQLREVVNQLPEGINTLVGENGIRLSGGQRQRVALARALYHEREVIIMDEATSALDQETEQAVTEAVHALQGERTFIIIAHRLTTLERCDVVYRLEEGRIVESASYAAVLGRNE